MENDQSWTGPEEVKMAMGEDVGRREDCEAVSQQPTL